MDKAYQAATQLCVEEFNANSNIFRVLVFEISDDSEDIRDSASSLNGLLNQFPMGFKEDS